MNHSIYRNTCRFRKVPGRGRIGEGRRQSADTNGAVSERSYRKRDKFPWTKVSHCRPRSARRQDMTAGSHPLSQVRRPVLHLCSRRGMVCAAGDLPVVRDRYGSESKEPADFKLLEVGVFFLHVENTPGPSDWRSFFLHRKHPLFICSYMGPYKPECVRNSKLVAVSNMPTHDKSRKGGGKKEDCESAQHRPIHAIGGLLS